MDSLSELQLLMLEAGSFCIDGWCSIKGREAADDLHRRGLLSMREGGSDEAQYTVYEYTVTEMAKHPAQR